MANKIIKQEWIISHELEATQARPVTQSTLSKTLANQYSYQRVIKFIQETNSASQENM